MPETAIEIPDKMVEAGIKALSSWDYDDLDEWKVCSVYTAMEAARVDAIKHLVGGVEKMDNSKQFSITARVQTFVGDTEKTITVTLTDERAIVVVQSGVTVTIDPEQVKALVANLSAP